VAGQRARPGTVTGAAVFTRSQTAAVMIVGIVGVLIPGLQPQLLGALLTEGRVSTSALGLLATAELLAMGIAAAASGLLLPVDRLRLVAGTALTVTALLDLATCWASEAALFAARTVAGLAEGVLIWIAIGLIVRVARPERWSGIYLALQTLAQLGFATALGLAIVPDWGASGGFALLALATITALAALPWLPRAYAGLTYDEASGTALPARGLVALAGVTLYLAFIVAVWVYIEPLGLQRDIDAATVRLVVPLALAMQVMGAATAAAIAGRLAPRRVVVCVAAGNLVLLAIMAAPPSAAAFVVATALFGFLWLFAMPFQVPILIAADPSRRAAVLIGGAQLIGSSLGPFVAALLVSDADVRPVLWFGAVCAVTGVMALVGAGFGRTIANTQPI